MHTVYIHIYVYNYTFMYLYTKRIRFVPSCYHHKTIGVEQKKTKKKKRKKKEQVKKSNKHLKTHSTKISEYLMG